jgi:hypothetical protein
MLLELRDINSELDSSLNTSSSSTCSSTLSSSSNSSSLSSSWSSSSSSTLSMPEPIPITPQPLSLVPNPKNSMFSYWAVRDNTVIDVEALAKRRVDDARLNSESIQSGAHRESKIALGSQTNTKTITADQTITEYGWRAANKKLAGNLHIISYLNVEKKIWCSACPCYVRDDNSEAHNVTGKHLKAAKKAVEANLHQTNIQNAINLSKTLSKCLPG